jgi:hypothetical protein
MHFAVTTAPDTDQHGGIHSCPKAQVQHPEVVAWHGCNCTSARAYDLNCIRLGTTSSQSLHTHTHRAALLPASSPNLKVPVVGALPKQITDPLPIIATIMQPRYSQPSSLCSSANIPRPQKQYARTAPSLLQGARAFQLASQAAARAADSAAKQGPAYQPPLRKAAS